MSFLRALGWKTLPADLYASAWQNHGGGVITHPRVLEFIAEETGCRPAFYGKWDKQGEPLAAMATWGNYLAGDHDAQVHFGIDARCDFGVPEIILPLSAGFRGAIGFKTRYLSPLSAPQVSNATLKLNKRWLCLAKGLGPDGLASSTCKRRRTQARVWERDGGEIRRIDQFTPAELAAVYADVFQRRWNKPHHTLATLPRFFEALFPLMTGHVALMNGEPAAYQLLLTARSARCYAVEYINGGYDHQWEHLSPGNVVTWLNLSACWQQSQDWQIPLRYSFGRNYHQYKKDWAIETHMARTISW
ncbi:GNAT family N-acetyltransferase [Paludibacterium sp. B53371]|uniref:GNAT family N-acetyltransferase n=1 Tax=Paludibacterium sp. B53371 TaxID=2806263 RepID=UPI001C05EB4B|nr:GNAT family N-acetyltransferase [Paludibacterium sp. B53371]